MGAIGNNLSRWGLAGGNNPWDMNDPHGLYVIWRELCGPGWRQLARCPKKLDDESVGGLQRYEYKSCIRVLPA